jgi:hypothetical protein
MLSPIFSKALNLKNLKKLLDNAEAMADDGYTNKEATQMAFKFSEEKIAKAVRIAPKYFGDDVIVKFTNRDGAPSFYKPDRHLGEYYVGYLGRDGSFVGLVDKRGDRDEFVAAI